MAGTTTITGNLSQDPTIKVVEVNGIGTPVCELRIGYTINRGKSPGNFITATTWGTAALAHSENLAKGSPVRVDGELQFDSWTDTKGTAQSRHSLINASVEYLGSRNSETPEIPPDTAEAS